MAFRSLIRLAGLTALTVTGPAQTLTIQNRALVAQFDEATASFALTARGAKQAFATDGRLRSDGGQARILAVTDPTLGRGQAIEINFGDGGADAILIFPDLPFALFRSTLHNASGGPVVTNRVPAPAFGIALGRPASELKTLGTGGLLAPDQNPGSYVWLAVVEPKSRHGVVSGWLTQARGSGVVFSSVDAGQVRAESRLEYGRLRLAPGQTETLETFAVGYFDDARLGLEAWADTIAKIDHIRLHPQPVGYCTWYSNPHGGSSDEQHLAELGAFAARELAPFGFSVVQIDDGWQAGLSTNGPKRNFTAHASNGPYRSGMKAIADRIKNDGLVPGIWFMPFAGTFYDPFFADRQDWFVKRPDGTPYETDWGGTCLDLTQPAVRDYLRANLRRLGREWGFRYFKMDGLWTGSATRQQYVNEGYRDDGMGDAVFHDPNVTNPEAYRGGLRLVRETDPDAFILGCCTPQNMRSYGGAFGLVDAMRIGPDNGADWEGLKRGPTFGTRHYFLNGRVWFNDPDPVYVRTSIPLNQAQLICSWVALSGQLNLSSEWLPGLPPERLDILKRTMPPHGLKPRPVDLFDEPLPRIWLLTDTRRAPRRDVIGLFNWSDTNATFDTSLERLGLPANGDYVAFDFWGDQLLPLAKGRLDVSVPARSCRILAVRPAWDRPQLLSTSRHVTQGIVDVLAEKWNRGTKTLTGRSQVVANDPYELRVLLPATGQPWSVARAELSAADQAIGATITISAQAGLARATIHAPTSREVGWTLRFRR
jgi:hypothetical protein